MRVQVCAPDISGAVGEARDSLATRYVTIAHFLRVFPLLRVAVDQVLLRDRAAAPRMRLPGADSSTVPSGRNRTAGDPGRMTGPETCRAFASTDWKRRPSPPHRFLQDVIAVRNGHRCRGRHVCPLAPEDLLAARAKRRPPSVCRLEDPLRAQH
jgi:hypothetical protein